MELLKPIHDSHPPGIMFEQPCEVTSVQKEFEAGHTMMPPNARYFTDSVFLTPGTNIVEACREMFTVLPASEPGSLAYWEPMKSRPEIGDLPMAMSIHSEHYVSLLAIYKDKDQDQKQQEWVMNWFRSMDNAGLLLGTYVGDAHPQDRPHRYWREDAEARIREIGAKWDPEQRLRGTIFGRS